MTTSNSAPILVTEAYVDLYARSSGFVSTAGVLIQNVSDTDDIWVNFGASAPTTGKSGNRLGPGEAISDKNGSANCWAMSVTGVARAMLSKD
jgi:hypothetical protein